MIEEDKGREHRKLAMELQCKSREQLQQLAWLRVRWMGMHPQIKPPVIGGRACKRLGRGGLGGSRGASRRPSPSFLELLARCSAEEEEDDRAEWDRGGRKKGSKACPGRWRTSETCPIMRGRLRPQPSPCWPPATPRRDSKFRASVVCERTRVCVGVWVRREREQ